MRPAELAQLKADAVGALMDTGQVWRRTSRTSDTGGQVLSEPDLVESTPCRILPIRPAAQAETVGLSATQLVHIVVPDDSVAQVGDEITIDSQRYAVTAMLRRAPYNLKRLDCTRV